MYELPLFLALYMYVCSGRGEQVLAVPPQVLEQPTLVGILLRCLQLYSTANHALLASSLTDVGRKSKQAQVSSVWITYERI